MLNSQCNAYFNYLSQNGYGFKSLSKIITIILIEENRAHRYKLPFVLQFPPEARSNILPQALRKPESLLTLVACLPLPTKGEHQYFAKGDARYPHYNQFVPRLQPHYSQTYNGYHFDSSLEVKASIAVPPPPPEGHANGILQCPQIVPLLVQHNTRCSLEKKL